MVNVLSTVMYSASHRQAGTTTINIQSALRTASSITLFGSNGNSYTNTTESGRRIHMFFTICRRKSVKRQTIRAAVKAACHWFGSPVLRIQEGICPRRGSDHSHPPCAEVTNTWTCTSITQC